MFFSRNIVEHRHIVSKLSPVLAPAPVPFEDFTYYRRYKPTCLAGEIAPYPTVLYIPGNAFVAGESDYTHFICTHVAQLSRCQVIVVRHRLAPEFQFPVGLLDAWKVVAMLLSEPRAKTLEIDRSQVAVIGYSSGGNFAARITIQAKLAALRIARQILISPITDLSRSLTGFETFQAQDKKISEQFVEWFSNLYIPAGFNRKHPNISPRWESDMNLRGLPPTDLIFGELDRYRGDSEVYRDRLKMQGNTVNTVMFKGETHGLLWHNIAVIHTIASRLSVAFTREPIQRLLTENAGVEIEAGLGEKAGIKENINATEGSVYVLQLDPKTYKDSESKPVASSALVEAGFNRSKKTLSSSVSIGSHRSAFDKPHLRGS